MQSRSMLIKVAACLLTATAAQADTLPSPWFTPGPFSACVPSHTPADFNESINDKGVIKVIADPSHVAIYVEIDYQTAGKARTRFFFQSRKSCQDFVSDDVNTPPERY